jgi:hypothetical protein
MLTGFVIGDRGLGSSGDTHPAWMMAHAEAGSYLIAGASAAGQLHLARQLPRDDAFIIRSLGPWLAVAVADGVGSRPLSRYGATYTVEALTTLLLRPFAPPLKAEKPAPPGGGTRAPAEQLVPPPTIEATDLKLPPDPKTRQKNFEAMLASIGSWLRELVTGPEPALPPELSAQELRQIGSIGWWPSPTQVNPPAEQQKPATSEVQQEPQQAAPPPQAPDLAEPAGMPDTPNLMSIMRDAFVKSHLGLRQHAENLKLNLADLGCTALALLFNTATRSGVVGQVGDGALLGLTARGRVQELACPPETDDPQSVYTITRPDFEKYLTLATIERPPADPFVAFYVMTDGVSADLLYSPRQEELEVWAQGVDQNLRSSPSPGQAAAGMLNWLATYQVKGSWDDRTLVVITQRERNHGDRQAAAGQSESTHTTDHQ